MSVLNNSNLKCRLCLVESQNERMSELFDNNKTSSASGLDGASSSMAQKRLTEDFKKLPLNEKVEFCCGVKLLPKPQMPSKICGKCINMIDMWYNFRQMCFNSQEFLASQIKFTLDQNSVASNDKELQQVRVDDVDDEELEIKDISFNSYVEDYDDIDYIQDDEDDPDYLYTDDNDVLGDDDDDDDNSSFYTNEDPMTAISQKLFQSNISEALSPEDYEEALNYLSAENDENIEKLIEHCATKNTALRMLKRKAVASIMRDRIPKKPTVVKKEPREKPMKPSMFMCNICGNVYSKKPLFQYHMRMHSEVKPYQCEICNKSYRIMSDLKNHMYRHTGERPFKCKHCDRHFMDRSSRHRHERVHTNSRPYTCNICNKSFTYSAILKNHLKLHTGEKDYICAVCNKSFTLAHQLKAHMLTLTHRQKEAAFEAQGYKVIFEASEMTKS